MLEKTINKVQSGADIKYKAPLSYRHIRIAGWIAMVFAQLAIVFAFCLKSWQDTPHNLNTISIFEGIFAQIGQLALPLFLIANFAIIFTSKEDIKKLLLYHLCVAIAIYGAFLLIYCRYLTGLSTKIFGDEGKTLLEATTKIFFSKYLTFNVFIDLLMCSLTYFFSMYIPKKYFTGKKIYIFRSLVIFPIAYEVASIVLKGLSLALGLFNIPVELFPLFTSKPIMTFASFLIIMTFLKIREKLYTKHTGSIEGYDKFQKSNRNKFQITLFISILFIIMALLDGILFLILKNIYMPEMILEYEGDIKAATTAFEHSMRIWGVGKSIPLALSVPFIMCFNFTRKYDKSSRIYDFLIPILGILLCFLTFIEGFYDVIVLK